MKNKILDRSVVRHPRGVVLVNGELLEGWLMFDWEENEFEQPDSFTVLVATSALPKAFDLAWWATSEKADIELLAGFPKEPTNFAAGELDVMFTGQVDDVSVDWDDMTMRLTGRDRTAKLVDNKTSEKYQNKTASEVATALATKYGLEPKVKATKNKVGRYYDIEHVDLKASRTEWDLLTWLAKQEGYSVFVRGKELYFQPRDDGEKDPYVFQWSPPNDEREFPTGNFEQLSTGRTMTIAKEVLVTVTSWDAKKKKSYKKTAKRAGSGGGDVQKYSFNVPGLTPEQVQELANKKLEEISRHAMTLQVRGAADNLLRIDDKIVLQGTGTAFDQAYFPESIGRTLTCEGGYGWDIRAKNKIEEAESEDA